MNRRSVLVASGVALSTVVAGCLFEDDSPEEGTCRLQHVVEAQSEETDAPEETYSYEELSKEARQVFDEVLTNNGFYTTTNQSLRSEEFRYQGVTSTYHVIYQNETYVLGTYVDEGCHGP